MPISSITARLAALQSWSHDWQHQIELIEHLLESEGFASTQANQALSELKARLLEQRITLAFIAEPGRGLSELINVLFFADMGRPLLPTGPGRVTRCMAEFRFDRRQPPSIRLLPIETREESSAYNELLADHDRWQTIRFAATEPQSVTNALAHLSETRQVSLAEAVSLGLHGESMSISTQPGATNVTLVEIPRWRHAIINFPHPLLEAGLTVIDVPGFSSLSSEAEFVHSRLISANVLLLVLDINTGVTREERIAWQQHLGGNRSLHEQAHENSSSTSLVILNKTDMLELEPDQDIQAEIRQRTNDIAAQLRVRPQYVIPVSARYAAMGKLTGDWDYIKRSQISEMEAAIVARLPDEQQVALSEEAHTTLSRIIDSIRSMLDNKHYALLSSIQQLNTLRLKNEKLITTLKEQTAARFDKLDAAIKEMRHLKTTHGRLTEELAERVHPNLAMKEARLTRHSIIASMMPGATQAAVDHYFATSQRQITQIEQKIDEIKALFADYATRMLGELKLRDAYTIPFPTQRFHTELQKAKQIAESEFMRPANVLSKLGGKLGEQFEEMVSNRIVHLFQIAHNETGVWARAQYNALDKPLKEARERLNQRIADIEKMSIAQLDLAERIAELQSQYDVIRRKRSRMQEAELALQKAAVQYIEANEIAPAIA